eukprot:1884340-Amphidinium_carterae.1
MAPAFVSQFWSAVHKAYEGPLYAAFISNYRTLAIVRLYRPTASTQAKGTRVSWSLLRNHTHNVDEMVQWDVSRCHQYRESHPE